MKTLHLLPITVSVYNQLVHQVDHHVFNVVTAAAFLRQTTAPTATAQAKKKKFSSVDAVKTSIRTRVHMRTYQLGLLSTCTVHD